MKYTLVLAGLLIPFCTQAGLGADPIVVKSSGLVQHLVMDVPLESYDPELEYSLVEVDHPDVRLPAQVIRATDAAGRVESAAYQIIASVPGVERSDADREFRLEKGATGKEDPAFTFQEDKLFLELREKVPGEQGQSRSIWRYNYGTIVDESVPESDSRRSRSCYIHPVWGVHGEVLTDDFPSDHYHHHGIFWTWPYVKVGGQVYDLWISSDIQQRFSKWLATEAGPVGAVMGVENGWFVGEQQVATERVWVRAYRSEPDCRAFDITLYIEAGDDAVTLLGRQKKSYGGLTFRYDVSPRKDATVRVPGKVLGYGAANQSGSPDLLNTRLPWADLTTRIPGAPRRSGAAVFIHPQHPDYPPTWLTRTYGALCVGWPGVESHTIKANKSIRLDYRIWIHAEEPDPDQIARRYGAYCESRAIEGAGSGD